MNEKRAKFNAAPVIATSSECVKAIPTGDGFADRLVAWAESNGVLGTYKNDDTGWGDIIVSRQSIRDVNYHYARAGKLAALQVLGELIRNGVYLETTRRNRQLVRVCGQECFEGDFLVAFVLIELGFRSEYALFVRKTGAEQRKCGKKAPK